MSDDIISLLKENVIQGRATKDDEGLEGALVGQPGVEELTQQALDQGIDVQRIIEEGLTDGMQVVGDKFAAKEYFIPDMLAAAEAVSKGMNILKPHLEASGVEPKGKFVIATVKGDLHDIGKNIVAILLRGSGYEVTDMGIDVPVEKIVGKVKESKPEFLGLSALLTTTMGVMGEVVEALKKGNVRDQVKVLVGGAAVSDEFAEEIGADAYCRDGFHALEVLEGYGGGS